MFLRRLLDDYHCLGMTEIIALCTDCGIIESGGGANTGKDERSRFRFVPAGDVSQSTQRIDIDKIQSTGGSVAEESTSPIARHKTLILFWWEVAHKYEKN